MKKQKPQWKPRRLNVAGHTHELYVESPQSECGNIAKGIALAFRNAHAHQGGWVVDFDDLKALIREVEDWRKA